MELWSSFSRFCSFAMSEIKAEPSNFALKKFKPQKKLLLQGQFYFYHLKNFKENEKSFFVGRPNFGGRIYLFFNSFDDGIQQGQF